jgi:hypothetical protein
MSWLSMILYTSFLSIHWINRGAVVRSVDPYPDPDSKFGSESGSRGAKMAHKNRKKIINLLF